MATPPPGTVGPTTKASTLAVPRVATYVPGSSSTVRSRGVLVASPVPASVGQVGFIQGAPERVTDAVAAVRLRRSNALISPCRCRRAIELVRTEEAPLTSFQGLPERHLAAVAAAAATLRRLDAAVAVQVGPSRAWRLPTRTGEPLIHD